MFKPGDVVRNIRVQWCGNNEKLDSTSLYVTDECIDHSVSLKYVYCGPIFATNAFKLVDPKTISELEREIYGLSE
jgi:hypothetical protein